MILCGFLVGRSVDQGSIHKPDPKIREFRGVSLGQSHFSDPFLLNDGMDMGTLKLLTSWGSVIVLVQPIGNLGVIPLFLPELTNGVVEELLVLGIGCSPEVTCTDR